MAPVFKNGAFLLYNHWILRYLVYICHNKMAKNQDSFRIEKKLKDRASKVAKDLGIGRSSLYRLAIVEFLKKHE